MTKKTSIKGSVENWKKGRLGKDANFAKPAGAGIELALDEALELIPISIRMPKSLIGTLKMIAGHHGIGYQPLMRDVLTRFARAEVRDILKGIEDQKNLESALSDEDSPAVKHLQEKCA